MSVGTDTRMVNIVSDRGPDPPTGRRDLAVGTSSWQRYRLLPNHFGSLLIMLSSAYDISSDNFSSKRTVFRRFTRDRVKAIMHRQN